MAEDLRALVDTLYDGLCRADIEAVLGLFDPLVEIETPPSLPWSAGNYTGLGGAASYFSSALGHLDETRFDVQEVHVEGEGEAAIGGWSCRFRASGCEFDVRFVHFWQFRDGKVVKGSGISDAVGIVRACAPDSLPAPN